MCMYEWCCLWACECGGVSMSEPGGLNGVSVVWCGGVSVMV